jgi:hypothetical protein
MNRRPIQVKQTQLPATQASLVEGVQQIPGAIASTSRTPKVIIKGDIRLQVPESYAAFRSVKGSYSLDIEDMKDPLQVIWIAEGRVLNHQRKAIDIEFDMKGAKAGQRWTYLVTAQVTDQGGLGCVVHSSVFVQILVAEDDFPVAVPQ